MAVKSLNYVARVGLLYTCTQARCVVNRKLTSHITKKLQLNSVLGRMSRRCCIFRFLEGKYALKPRNCFTANSERQSYARLSAQDATIHNNMVLTNSAKPLPLHILGSTKTFNNKSAPSLATLSLADQSAASCFCTAPNSVYQLVADTGLRGITVFHGRLVQQFSRTQQRYDTQEE